MRLRHDYWYVDPLCQAFNKPWDEEPDTYVNSNDGCIYSIDCHCGPIIAGKGCLPSSIPASTINNCLPRKMNLATVILFEDQLKLKYPQYTNSTQLYEFVHNTVLPSQIKRNQAVCSNITFCQTDFRILKEPDFDIECNTASVVPVPVGEEDVVGYYIDSEGELQPWDIGSFEYYPTCLLTETGIGICNGSYPRVVCENIELNEALRNLGQVII